MHAITTFCDDIRFEQGNKTSLMGIYQSDLVVPVKPTVLPKLIVLTTVVAPLDEPFVNLTVRVTRDGSLLHEEVMPTDAAKQFLQDVASQSDPSDPYTRLSVSVLIGLSPFVVDAEFTLKVEVVADGEAFPSGRLRVRHAMSDDAAIQSS